jgi:hypothetical protein
MNVGLGEKVVKEKIMEEGNETRGGGDILDDSGVVIWFLTC